MGEGFQCDRCGEFIPYVNLKFRIEEYMWYNKWITKSTFCKPCYRKVLDFIKNGS